MFYATHQFEVKFSKILRGEGGGGGVDDEGGRGSDRFRIFLQGPRK